MSMLLFMLPFMVAFAVLLLALFLWAVKSDQFEDLEGEKHRILFDDGPRPIEAGSPATRRPTPGRR